MNGFEITARHNILCQLGRRIKIKTQAQKIDTHNTAKWEKYTVIKSYEHFVLMRHEKGYRESFTHFEIEQLIRRNELKKGD